MENNRYQHSSIDRPSLRERTNRPQSVSKAVNGYYREVVTTNLSHEPALIRRVRWAIDRVKEGVNGVIGAGIGGFVGQQIGRVAAGVASVLVGNPGPSIMYEKIGIIAGAAAGLFAGVNIAGRWRERRLQRQQKQLALRQAQYEELFTELKYKEQDLRIQNLQLEGALLANEVLMQQQEMAYGAQIYDYEDLHDHHHSHQHDMPTMQQDLYPDRQPPVYGNYYQ